MSSSWGGIGQFERSFLTTEMFVTRAFRALDVIDSSEVRRRSTPAAKRLIEEVWPLTAFLRGLDKPERRVRCRYFSGNQNYDAQIRLSGREVDIGFCERTYYVEITTAASKVDYLRREALDRYGSVFGGEDIQRVGSRKKGDERVISKIIAEDGRAAAQKLAEWIRDRVHEKLAKKYPSPSILLVNAQPDRPLDLDEWLPVLTATHASINAHTGVVPFEWVYVVDPNASFMHCVWRKPRSGVRAETAE